MKNEIHYDLCENTQKSITPKNFVIPTDSRSFPIDDTNILICGGQPKSMSFYVDLTNFFAQVNQDWSKFCKINIETKEIKYLASMNTGRIEFFITYMNDFYYALGGRNNRFQPMKKCERYSLKNNKWDNIAGLKNPRNNATCVSVPKKDCIYLIGGQDQMENLNKNIEKYDAAANKWTVIKLKKQFLVIT